MTIADWIFVTIKSLYSVIFSSARGLNLPLAGWPWSHKFAYCRCPDMVLLLCIAGPFVHCNKLYCLKLVLLRTIWLPFLLMGDTGRMGRPQLVAGLSWCQTFWLVGRRLEFSHCCRFRRPVAGDLSEGMEDHCRLAGMNCLASLAARAARCSNSWQRSRMETVLQTSRSSTTSSNLMTWLSTDEVMFAIDSSSLELVLLACCLCSWLSSKSGMLFHFFLFMLGVELLLLLGVGVEVNNSASCWTRRQNSSQNWAIFRTQ